MPDTLRFDTNRTLDDLSPRHRQVAELVARGLSNEQIAIELGVVKGTVSRWICDLYDLLGIEDAGTMRRVMLARFVWEGEVKDLVAELLERWEIAA